MLLADVGDVVSGVTVNTMVASLLELSSKVLGFIVGNPLLLTLFGGSVIGVACYVVKKVKKTSKA